MHDVNTLSSTTTAPLAGGEFSFAYIQLLQALQTSLHTDALLNNFFKHIQPIINVTGIVFSHGEERISLGRETIHSCDYNLTLEQIHLGNILFYRTSRWIESERQTIEQLLSYFAYPLRNALQHQQVIALTRIDGLTGVGNRASFNEYIEHEISLAVRHPKPLSLVMIDIDHFKSINDTHGHTVGDKALTCVAQMINQACRNTDKVFRYGGEEFAVVLSNTDHEGAKIFADRLCECFSKLHINVDNISLRITASLGISEFRTTDTVHTLVNRADAALYRAKYKGRNRSEGSN